jgi:phage portal protein BeeE
VGFWRNVFGLDIPAPDVDPDSAPTFAIDPSELIGGADIDPAVFGLEGYESSIGPAPRIDRRSAIQVPAVKRSRDLIAGVLGGLPLDLFDQDKNTIENPFFRQPERNVPRSVSMTRLVEDMLFEGVAWWQITESYAWGGWPMYVKRLRPGRVTVDEDRGLVYVDGRETDQSTLIRFDSPTEGLLKAGARAIRTCLYLDTYAANAAQGIPPLDYFTPAEDSDPFASTLEDEEAAAAEEEAAIAEFLAQHAAARRARTTGYYPASVKYNIAGFDPKALQMAEQRQHAVLEIARVAGIDADELGVSVTSRTYSNQFDRRKAFTDFTLGLYRQAVEDRLSMGDVTPRGQYAKFNLDAFLRSDPAARYAAYEAGLRVGAIAEDEIRPMEDKPQLTAAQKPQAVEPAPLRSLPTRTEESA